jgi:pimeloyl-ACP methyl ester carboxylesterase
MRTVAAGGIELALREWGEPDCPPMVCWHGAGDTSRRFEQAAEVWTNEDGLRVLAPDAPGHGRSPALQDGDYRPSRLAAAAAALLDAAQIQQTVWCGFAWGATIGCYFAAAYPQRTRALVLIGGGFVDLRDDTRTSEPAPDDTSLDAALQRGMRAEAAADVYDRLGGTPVMLLAASVDAWRAALRFEPLERFRQRVPQADVHELEGVERHDLLSADVRNHARLVGDWLSDRGLV